MNSQCREHGYVSNTRPDEGFTTLGSNVKDDGNHNYYVYFLVEDKGNLKKSPSLLLNYGSRSPGRGNRTGFCRGRTDGRTDDGVGPSVSE